MKVFHLTATALFITGILVAENKPRMCRLRTYYAGQEIMTFTSLFPENGIPKGWLVRDWADVSKPAADGSKFEVKDGVLEGSPERGCWLISEKEYSNFILEYEFKLGSMGNSGCAILAPLQGDPAFDGMEIQMVDQRYNPQAKESELTAGVYRAVAPSKQVYKPGEWNTMRIEVDGSSLKVTLNGVLVQEIDFDKFTETVPRHDGKPAPALKDRPQKGHIGFQELSRGGSHVLIRKARIADFGNGQISVDYKF